jgi:hypothetical protein
MPSSAHYRTMTQRHGLKTQAHATFPGINKMPKIGAAPLVGAKPKVAKKVQRTY